MSRPNDGDPNREEPSEVQPRDREQPPPPDRKKPPNKLTSALAAKQSKLIDGKWGGGPGQFGRRRDEEANPEAPMSIAAAQNGEVLVLDQVNHRVQVLRDGKMVNTIPATDTVQDLAIGPDGKTVLLDRHADQKVQVYDASGKLINEVPIAGKGLEEAGRATGVFAESDGIWVENEHSSVVRVADADGNADEERPELPGRPTRDGRAVVTAAVTDRAAGRFVLTAFDRQTLEALWSEVIELPLPILQLIAVESDAAGTVYVGAHVGRESPEDPFPIIEEKILVVRVSALGRVSGMIELPVTKTGDEMMRPLSVGADGAIYLMAPSDTGLSVSRYDFPG